MVEWTTGDSTGGMNGLGGREAEIGYDAGDGVNYHSIYLSGTPEIINIASTSNVNRNGLWAFRLDMGEDKDPFAPATTDDQYSPLTIENLFTPAPTENHYSASTTEDSFTRAIAETQYSASTTEDLATTENPFIVATIEVTPTAPTTEVASTVPTTEVTSTVPTTEVASTVPTTEVASTVPTTAVIFNMLIYNWLPSKCTISLF